MKKFLKLLVTIIVILVIGYTIYFLMENTSQYNARNSGDLIFNNSDDILNQSGNNEISLENQSGNAENMKLPSGEENVEFEQTNNTEIIGNEDEEVGISGDNQLQNDWESKVEEIKNIKNQNLSAIPTKTLEENIDIDIIVGKDKVFSELSKISQVSGTVQVAGSMVYIMPDSELLDNTQYHYDKNGNLILYVRELSEYDKEARYYFENGTPIIINFTVEKKHQMDFEKAEEIFQRAKLVYEKYMN